MGRGIGRLSYYVIKSIQRPLNYRQCNSAVKYHHFHSGVNSILDQSLLKNVCSHPLNDRTTANWLISSQKNLLHSKISSHGLVKLYTTQSPSQRARKKAARSDIATQDEDPFDSLTDKIPQKPVTFVEGASYSFIILVGFAVAGFAAYGVFKELIFEPKEYKVFNKALHRIQSDNQVTVRIGSPITGYGQDTRNRAARQHIPHRAWSDEDGVQRVEVQFYVRGPHGYGQVHSEMFKDREDKQWKFTYLIVDIVAPSPTRLMLESYVPA